MLDDNNALLKRLEETFSYEPETGLFRWKCDRKRGIEAGSIAGHLNEYGYWMLWLDGRNHRAHRAAFLMHFKRLVDADIDHINGIRTDNRIANLRAVSRQMNLQNQVNPSKNNKSGFLGVSPNRDRFSASIRANRKKMHLGTFDTPELAHSAYMAAKAQLHAGFVVSRLEQ